jgi:hypothetical protein
LTRVQFGLRLGDRHNRAAIVGDAALATASALETNGDAHDEGVAVDPNAL